MRVTALTWRNSEYTVELAGVESTTHTCGIMQDCTADVELLGLPSAWDVKGAAVNTVTLPCGHTFHPTALVQHFALRDMRCPVCRQGDSGRVSLRRSDVPLEVAAAVRSSTARIKESESSDDESSDLAIDLDSVRELLTLHAQVFVKQQEFISLSSRCIPCAGPSEGPGEGGESFAMHRSFARLLFTNVRNFAKFEDSFVRFSIAHPLVCYPIVSEPVDMPALLASVSAPLTATATGHAALARVHVDGAQPALHVDVDVDAVARLCMHAISAQLIFIGSL